MIKNKIYIDVRRTQTIRIEVSEDEGYDIPEDMVGFAEFYAELKMTNAWDIVRDVDWDKAIIEGIDSNISIAK